jgi:hypothetical protein
VEVTDELVVEDAGADLQQEVAPRGVQRICCLTMRLLMIWLAADSANTAEMTSPARWAWAIAAAQRRLDLLGAVAAFSVGRRPAADQGRVPFGQSPALPGGRHARAGLPGSAREWAERLRRAGLPCRHEEWIGGHDQVWWPRQLPVALGWLLWA